jgi:hypothetical protein
MVDTSTSQPRVDRIFDLRSSPKIRRSGKFVIGKKSAQEADGVCGLRPRSIAQHFIFRQFRQEKRFRVAWHRTAVDDARPQIDGRRCDEGGAQRHDLEIVVQVLALTTIERPTGGARVALSVMANAPKITSGFVGKENISAEIYLLRSPFEAPANPGKRGKIYVGVDSDEHISVLGDGLGSRQ